MFGIGLLLHFMFFFLAYRILRRKGYYVEQKEEDINDIFTGFATIPLFGSIVFLIRAILLINKREQWAQERESRNDTIREIQKQRKENDAIHKYEKHNGIEYARIPETDYYMSKYPITRKQWFNIMITEPWKSMKDECINLDVPVDHDKPVTNVSIEDIEKFIATISSENLIYSLPIYEEWMHAFLADKRKNSITIPKDSQYDTNQGWVPKYPVWSSILERVVSDGKSPIIPDEADCIFPVGCWFPNSWGLFDMSGNVWEWCRPGDEHGKFGGVGCYGRPKDLFPWGEKGDNFFYRYCELSSTSKHPFFSFRLVMRKNKVNK